MSNNNILKHHEQEDDHSLVTADIDGEDITGDLDSLNSVLGYNPSEDHDQQVQYDDVQYEYHPQVDEGVSNDRSLAVIPEQLHPRLGDPLPLSEEECKAALHLNRDYQVFLKEQLRKVVDAQKRTDEAIKKLNAQQAQNARQQRKANSIKKTVQPYFMDSEGNRPPLNPDAQARADKLSVVPRFKFRKWSKAERDALSEGVRQQNQKILYSHFYDQLRENKITPEDFERETTAIRRLTPKELEQQVVGVSWAEIAKNHVPSRSPEDCEIQWVNNDSPLVNNEPWTKDEDKRLRQLAKTHKGHNWEVVARELGTGRTPVTCLSRFQRSLNRNMMKSKWTPEEDQKLRDAVKKCGEGNWQQIAYCLEGRTGQQCLHRWGKTLSPSIRKGRWAPEEDTMLINAVNIEGIGAWNKVQSHVPGRTDMQCRERYMNVLNPNLKKENWTPEEDAKLKQLIAAKGMGKWSVIAKEMGTRTDNQCWRRWKSLSETDEVNNYKKQIQKRKRTKVANFVGRSAERPAGYDYDEEEEDEEPTIVDGAVDAAAALTTISAPPDLTPTGRPRRKRGGGGTRAPPRKRQTTPRSRKAAATTTTATTTTTTTTTTSYAVGENDDVDVVHISESATSSTSGDVLLRTAPSVSVNIPSQNNNNNTPVQQTTTNSNIIPIASVNRNPTVQHQQHNNNNNNPTRNNNNNTTTTTRNNNTTTTTTTTTRNTTTTTTRNNNTNTNNTNNNNTTTTTRNNNINNNINNNNNNNTEVSPSLPLVYPSPTTFKALHNLFVGLDLIFQYNTTASNNNNNTNNNTRNNARNNARNNNNNNNSNNNNNTNNNNSNSNNNNNNNKTSLDNTENTYKQFPTTHVFHHVEEPEFKLLAAWFNSLFLYPLLIVRNGSIGDKYDSDMGMDYSDEELEEDYDEEDEEEL